MLRGVQADLDAELWLNEYAVECLPAKADALVGLVRSLVAPGVPIDGVGLQTHLIADIPIAPGSFGLLVERLRRLGVEVAITEMDVPTGPTRDSTAQATIYTQITGECPEAGCSEITVRGVDDSHTWLDDPGIRAALRTLTAFPVPCTPLLLDPDYRPKSAYRAVATQLAEHRLQQVSRHERRPGPHRPSGRRVRGQSSRDRRSRALRPRYGRLHGKAASSPTQTRSGALPPSDSI